MSLLFFYVYVLVACTDYVPTGPSFADWGVLSLSYCTSLKSFTSIFDENSFLRGSSLQCGQSLIHILSHITRDIQVVNIQFGQWPITCKCAANAIVQPEMTPFWEEFNIVLSKFDCLKRLEFWFVIQEEKVKPAWEEGIKKHLNKYIERGIVSFSSRYDLRQPKGEAEPHWPS